MKKVFKIIIFLLAVVAIIGWIFVVRTKENELLKNIEGKMIYFYGQGCSHCANVENFFEENRIEEKIQFEKKEVYNDKGNANLLILVAKRKCNFKENEIRIPFLWDGSKCIVDDQPIINYFKEKIVITSKENEILKSIEGKMFYFYGQGCPHCAKVEKFLEENEIKGKIQFEEKEVYNDRENAKLLILIAQRKCNFKGNEIGVPFLWDGENEKCIVGDEPIINFFKEKLKI